MSEPITNNDKKRAARRRFLRGMGLLLVSGAATVADARYIEPHWVDLTRHNVFLPELPLALDGMTVAQLTDLHYGPVTPHSTIVEAIRLAAGAHPDLVVLTGDFVKREPAQAVELAPLLAPLEAARYGMIATLGNHDYADGRGDAVADGLTRNCRVRFLRNASEETAPGLFVAGIEDTFRGKPDTARAMAGVPPGAACLFLTHNPVGVWSVADHSCFALSGHTHGGQIRIPGLRPWFPPGMAGFPIIAGWGSFGAAQLYINRGVGVTGHRLRFRCRPEVAVFTLRRGAGTPESVSGEGKRGARIPVRAFPKTG